VTYNIPGGSAQYERPETPSEPREVEVISHGITWIFTADGEGVTLEGRPTYHSLSDFADLFVGVDDYHPPWPVLLPVKGREVPRAIIEWFVGSDHWGDLLFDARRPQ